MNQILAYNPIKNSDNKNFDGGNKKGSDKAVKILAILLIIFALALVGVGGYNYLKNSSNSKAAENVTTKATITFEKQDNGKVKVIITHDKAIESASYKWDIENTKENEIKGDGTNYLEFEVVLPTGQQTLEVKVVDIDGNETSSSETFTTEEGADFVNPNIQVDIGTNKKIKVTVTDETELAYVTYRWNDEEEERIDVETEELIDEEESEEETVSEDSSVVTSKKSIEFEIEILKGSNHLTIIAVDAAENTSTYSNDFEGITKPEIKITISEDKTSAEIYVYHDNGIEQIIVTLNGTETDVTSQTVPNKEKETTFGINLAEGENELTVKAVSVDKTDTVVSETITNTPVSLENIKIEASADDDHNLVIKTQYDGGIENISVQIAENTYGLGDGLQVGTTEEVSFTIPNDLIPAGETTVVVTVKGLDGNEASQNYVLTK